MGQRYHDSYTNKEKTTMASIASMSLFGPPSGELDVQISMPFSLKDTKAKNDRVSDPP